MGFYNETQLKAKLLNEDKRGKGDNSPTTSSYPYKILCFWSVCSTTQNRWNKATKSKWYIENWKKEQDWKVIILVDWITIMGGYQRREEKQVHGYDGCGNRSQTTASATTPSPSLLQASTSLWTLIDFPQVLIFSHLLLSSTIS